jgi:hypothetical protein
MMCFVDASAKIGKADGDGGRKPVRVVRETDKK